MTVVHAVHRGNHEAEVSIAIQAGAEKIQPFLECNELNYGCLLEAQLLWHWFVEIFKLKENTKRSHRYVRAGLVPAEGNIGQSRISNMHCISSIIHAWQYCA